MEDDKKPASRKSSVANSNGKEKDKISNGGGGDIQLKAKMSLLNGITVIVGSIIGNCNTEKKFSRLI